MKDDVRSSLEMPDRIYRLKSSYKAESGKPMCILSPDSD